MNPSTPPPRELTAILAALDDLSPNALTSCPGWTAHRTVPVAGFATHLRSEDALHRWDLVGDDDVSADLLAQEELLRHAVTFIGRPLIGRGLSAGAGDDPFVARVRSVDQADLIVEAGAGEARVSIGPPTDVAAIDGDPAARLLLPGGASLRRSSD
jgi:hypothetical protein